MSAHHRGTVARRVWSEEETANLAAHKAAGRTDEECAALMGRTLHSIRERRNYVGMNPDGSIDEARGEAHRLKIRGMVNALRKHGAGRIIEKPGLPKDRYPRGHDNLTALICGDPAPGRSALDQKRTST